jgi:hypothetical protein
MEIRPLEFFGRLNADPIFRREVRLSARPFKPLPSPRFSIL